MKTRLFVSVLVLGVWLSSPRAWAQASALPSAQAPSVSDPSARGRTLLDEMVTALGGEAWLGLQSERLEGRSATFYEGRPNPYETQFEEYLRLQPFAERVVVVSKQGVFIPTTKRDVAEIWTPDGGYEVSYHGRKPIPKVDVDDFQRRRMHSIEVVIHDWLKNPGTIVTYEGTDLDDRHLVDKISLINTDNDSVTLGLDQASHLPRSRTFQYRDPVYKDLNTELERYDNWMPEDGLMTALTITRYHNGDMTNQRFLTKVQYGVQLTPDLFNVDQPANPRK